MTLDDREMENSLDINISQTVYAPLPRAYLCVSWAILLPTVANTVTDILVNLGIILTG